MGRRRGEIWYVDLTDSKGHEQRGRRPAIVLAVSHAGITTVIPLTTQSNALTCGGEGGGAGSPRSLGRG
ncbi:MAG: type II toxin-antitoxin system PemK/MazF family toxin [Methanomicrobiales archaeon]|nr:type II toxin-antitoxin system PemK/MazF family toxin [Methanomicrobiales archaeon]